jgi:hypothetical protein
MLPNDPEREAVGRSVAAVLMAKQIRQSGSIHPETILTEIGALAGFAAQMSIRKGVIEPHATSADNLFVEVTAKSGEKFYFSDLLNWILFENTSEPPYCIWSYLCAIVPQDTLPQMPDVAEIVRNAARTVGSRRFGVPRLPAVHMPKIMPRVALDEHWRMVREELIASARGPSQWPYDLAVAAQWQMATSRGSLALPLAAAIVMEASIPMSKVDPRTVMGA